MEKFFFERKNELALELGVHSQETCEVCLTMWELQFDCIIKQTGKNAQIRLTGTSSQQWLQKLQLTAWALSNHIQGVLFLKGIKDLTKTFSPSLF